MVDRYAVKFLLKEPFVWFVNTLAYPWSMWIIAPEDLVVLKMMFFRRKDLADIEAVLRDRGATFDRGYVRRKLVELAGAEDERVRAWDELARDVAS